MANKSKLTLSLQLNSEKSPLSGVGPGVGLTFIKAYFPAAQNTIRIASAYFTLKGYKLGKDFISPQTQLQILVGREEGVHAKDVLIDEIVADFGDCGEDLHDAILDLLQRIENGQFVIKDARELQVKFHCKFYICDDKYIWHGSANYTGKGLEQSAEQVSVSGDSEQIKLFTRWYDDALKDARDLLAELIERLESLINLAEPFNVYLKTLYLLNNSPELKRRPNANIPTYYQKGVIANAVNQAREFGGGIIVAATGLGKTIIGAEIALYLQSTQNIKRVILIAPNGVIENWENAFESLDVYPKYFNTGVLFRKPSKGVSKANELDKILKGSDHETLIIIDEAHFYRNQLLSEKIKGEKSLVYKRLVPVIKAGAKIFLLTATVYGTNYQNLNSLLYLLPHRQIDSLTKLVPWEAKNPDEFTKLPVVTILGLPHVLKMAKDKRDVDENGRTFIQISDKRKYLPERIRLYSVYYELFLQEEIENAFEELCFDQAKKISKSWFDDSTLTIREGITDAGRKTSVESWLSSPMAMADNIENNLTTSTYVDKYDLPQHENPNSQVSFEKRRDLMHLSLLERKKILKPIAGKLASLSVDDKLLKLNEIIVKHCVEMEGKVIIFVNRHLTALYLLNALNQLFIGKIKVGCTVELGKDGTRLGKNRPETLKKFSPLSHNLASNEVSDEEYNVLICTDADGVGINLQDADTVVNYDPPDSADVLFQRAGRVLRMTDDPGRIVHFYRLERHWCINRKVGAIHLLE
ncbi:MAG: DEAD/DEAH box helicase family protein [Anaerolineales bacterium]|nr:DEAD/DEAH box helicase family protein [Anaerolineales bacterium]